MVGTGSGVAGTRARAARLRGQPRPHRVWAVAAPVRLRHQLAARFVERRDDRIGRLRDEPPRPGRCGSSRRWGRSSSQCLARAGEWIAAREGATVRRRGGATRSAARCGGPQRPAASRPCPTLIGSALIGSARWSSPPRWTSRGGQDRPSSARARISRSGVDRAAKTPDGQAGVARPWLARPGSAPGRDNQAWGSQAWGSQARTPPRWVISHLGVRPVEAYAREA